MPSLSTNSVLFHYLSCSVYQHHQRKRRKTQESRKLRSLLGNNLEKHRQKKLEFLVLMKNLETKRKMNLRLFTQQKLGNQLQSKESPPVLRLCSNKLETQVTKLLFLDFGYYATSKPLLTALKQFLANLRGMLSIFFQPVEVKLVFNFWITENYHLIQTVLTSKKCLQLKDKTYSRFQISKKQKKCVS